MAVSPIDTYRRQIERELQAGNATEHTHRPALKTLIESLAPGATATNEPKHVECGAPDFVTWRKAQHGPMKLGYIEAKDVGKDLGEVERSDQVKRYRSALPNLILTDYLEFRWYVIRSTPRVTRRVHKTQRKTLSGWRRCSEVRRPRLNLAFRADPGRLARRHEAGERRPLRLPPGGQPNVQS